MSQTDYLKYSVVQRASELSGKPVEEIAEISAYIFTALIQLLLERHKVYLPGVGNLNVTDKKIYLQQTKGCLWGVLRLDQEPVVDILIALQGKTVKAFDRLKEKFKIRKKQDEIAWEKMLEYRRRQKEKQKEKQND